jgi:glycosyltransferase involved in cell wall biosynthesis
LRPILAPPPAAPLSRGEPPTFSAIIAAYQAAIFIGDAIESLLAQTLPPMEIIVCDDGSTDDLDGALARYRERITLLRKENGGEASAKNAAAGAASGDFLAILDADDVYSPERLEALAELSVRRPDLDVLTTDCRIIVDGRFVRNCYHDDFPIHDQRLAILAGNFVGPGHMAVRRESFLAIGGFDESFRWATDWDCWIRMIFAGSRVGLVNQPLAEYRVRDTGLASDRTRLIEARVALLQKATHRTDLSAEERALLNRSLAAQRRSLCLYRAREALVEARPEARRLAFDLALNRDFPSRARLKAAFAVALPRLAGKRLVARNQHRRELAGDIDL